MTLNLLRGDPKCFINNFLEPSRGRNIKELDDLKTLDAVIDIIGGVKPVEPVYWNEGLAMIAEGKCG